MIVADTNALLNLFLPQSLTEAFERLLLMDAEWCVPRLWRSEFRNALSVAVRSSVVSVEQAITFCDEAEALVRGREYEVDSPSVLSLASTSGCSAYDCEFVVLADALQCTLVTEDRELQRRFPDVAVAVQAYLAPPA